MGIVYWAIACWEIRSPMSEKLSETFHLFRLSYCAVKRNFNSPNKVWARNYLQLENIRNFGLKQPPNELLKTIKVSVTTVGILHR
jgi:hypothetical protein